MLTPFDHEWQDCTGGNNERFLAEFEWAPNDDISALDCFNRWDKDLFKDPDTGAFRFDTIRPDNTQGYYLSGMRTFWVISCAENEEEVILFCNDLAQGFSANYTYYRCLKP